MLDYSLNCPTVIDRSHFVISTFFLQSTLELKQTRRIYTVQLLHLTMQ